MTEVSAESISCKNNFSYIIKHDYEESSFTQIPTTLIQFTDCDTEFFKQVAYRNQIFSPRLLQLIGIYNQCQTTVCKQDT